MASSSTGEQRQEVFRLPARWSVLRPLCRLAPALPGPLHPTSIAPCHVFRAGMRRRVPYDPSRYKKNEVTTARSQHRPKSGRAGATTSSNEGRTVDYAAPIEHGMLAHDVINVPRNARRRIRIRSTISPDGRSTIVTFLIMKTLA